jgi:hypothetical protein
LRNSSGRRRAAQRPAQGGEGDERGEPPGVQADRADDRGEADREDGGEREAPVVPDDEVPDGEAGAADHGGAPSAR